MMVKVLLIDPTKGQTIEGRTVKPVNPFLGLAYIGSFLQRDCDVAIKIVDMRASRMTFPELAQMIHDYEPDLVGITAKTFNILAAYKAASVAKEMTKAVTVLGGAHATSLPNLTLEECPDLDAVCLGEGELTMREIVERLSDGIRPPELFLDMAGVAYRREAGTVQRNPDRELIADLDLLPFPDYSLYDLKRYGKSYNPIRHRFDTVFPILASRGCPYRCIFCMPVLTRRIRYRSVANVIEEIRYLHDSYAVHRLYFEDSAFCVNRAWFDEFCQEFIASGLSKEVTWGFETRVDLTQHEGLFEQAKAAGCTYVYFGIESGSEAVLIGSKKGITKEQVQRAVGLAQKAGINEVGGSFIFGLPYETKASLEETLQFIRELRLDLVLSNIVSIYPGTELWDMVESGEGGIRWLPGMRYNWTSYSRSTCQTVVNDFGVEDLLQALSRARREGFSSMRRRSTVSFLLMAQAYLRYYLRNDPQRLAQYVRQYLFGFR